MSAAVRFVAEPDGFGGVRHVPRPASELPPPGRARRGRVVPDPIKSARSDSTAQTLRQFIERIEGVNEEIAGLHDDKRDILAEAKAQGFDTATMLKIVDLRKVEKSVLDEAEGLLATYRDALGLS